VLNEVQGLVNVMLPISVGAKGQQDAQSRTARLREVDDSCSQSSVVCTIGLLGMGWAIANIYLFNVLQCQYPPNPVHGTARLVDTIRQRYIIGVKGLLYVRIAQAPKLDGVIDDLLPLLLHVQAPGSVWVWQVLLAQHARRSHGHGACCKVVDLSIVERYDGPGLIVFWERPMEGTCKSKHHVAATRFSLQRVWPRIFRNHVQRLANEDGALVDKEVLLHSLLQQVSKAFDVVDLANI